ncbi:MAG: asparaginase domain-containing protein [Treponema sp.]|nr:asparaginase domain-containing protein [Treponema sp.]
MYKSYIFLEIRILLPSETKAFCGCAGAEVSCPVCREEPGALPVLNAGAALKAGLLIRGLGGTIIERAPYERSRNAPALPGGYALSRLSVKLGTDGGLDIMFHRRKKRIRITEIRLEEDAGRLIHSNKSGKAETWMDYSRAGMPSLRIRTAADFEIGEETGVFLSDLRRRIQYLEIIPGPAAETGIRCNAYVAMAPYPQEPVDFVKLRNLNSFNFVWKAVNAELFRQEEIVTSGGTVMPESRIWNDSDQKTESFQIRAAGERPRFIPVKVPPFVYADLPGAGAATPELPEARRSRLVMDYGLSPQQGEFICDEKSRADYFEKTLFLGAPPEEAAQWMIYAVKEFKRLGFTPGNAPLSPERFTAILRMLEDRRIHGSIARQLIAAVLKEDSDPGDIVRERGWEQLADRKLIEEVVKSVIGANPQEVNRIREGDAGPIQFLTGLIMRETGGLAEPTLVKELLREQLSVSLIYVLSMGGAISGRTAEDGTVESGDERVLRDLLVKNKARVRFEPVQVGRLLSEEIVPSDWAALIETVAERLNSGNANGIVTAHGTDTLPYTAPLLYWLFAGAAAPIVLAASSTPPGVSSEARRTMEKAVDLALKKPGGVYVVHGGRVLSPLNLKFERIGGDCFRNWNMGPPVFSGTALLTGPLEADRYVLAQLLEEAVNSMCVIRIYPGLRSDYLLSLMDRGVKNFFLELYDTGTAGFREGPYSLKRVFAAGKRRQVRFYCTSQQEGIVDFSGYSTSRELWREGAVPMGACTTETAVARFLAASIIADNEEERARLME